MNIIKRLTGRDVSGLSKKEVFEFCAGYDFDFLIEFYNNQPGIEPVPESEITELREFLASFGCPPALLYSVSPLRRSVPLAEYSYNFAGLKREFTRVKGEKVRTVYRDSLGRKVVQKDRVYTYSDDNIPLSKMTTNIWFYSDGTEALRSVLDADFTNDIVAAKEKRQKRMNLNLIDVQDWLREQGLKNSDFKKLAAAMAPHLETYRNGITEGLLAAIDADSLTLPAGLKQELKERLSV